MRRRNIAGSAIRLVKKRELTVARVIEFYIPASFRKKTMRWIPLENRGKVLEFISQAKKSA